MASCLLADDRPNMNEASTSSCMRVDDGRRGETRYRSRRNAGNNRPDSVCRAPSKLKVYYYVHLDSTLRVDAVTYVFCTVYQ